MHERWNSLSNDPFERSALSSEAISFLVRQHETALQSLVQWRGDTDVKLVRLENKVETVHAEVQDMRSSVDRLSKRIGMFTFSIAGGAITFAFTVLAATGKI